MSRIPPGIQTSVIPRLNFMKGIKFGGKRSPCPSACGMKGILRYGSFVNLRLLKLMLLPFASDKRITKEQIDLLQGFAFRLHEDEAGYELSQRR